MNVPEFLLSILAAGGGGAVIAFGIVQSFGDKWLDSKFASRLQDLRHEHERQMERIRLDTSRLLDRSTRLSQREFEVSAEAWSLVFDVYARTMGAMPGFRQHDDFAHLSDELARIVANKNSFEDWEINELLERAKRDRNSYFSERKRIHEMRDAKVAVRDASNYLDRKALFLDKDVCSQLKEFVDSAWKAIVAREIVLEAGPGELEGVRRDDNEFRANAEDQIRQLEQVARSRLWDTPDNERIEE